MGFVAVPSDPFEMLLEAVGSLFRPYLAAAAETTTSALSLLALGGATPSKIAEASESAGSHFEPFLAAASETATIVISASLGSVTSSSCMESSHSTGSTSVESTPTASEAVMPASSESCPSCSKSGHGHDMLYRRLEELASESRVFAHIAVWTQAFFGRTVDHHTLVYEYFERSRCLMSLKIDWCRDGVSFSDSSEDPCPTGDVVMRKCCRLSPAEVRRQIAGVEERPYDLIRWNCQHFCQYFFDLAPEAFAGGRHGSFGA